MFLRKNHSNATGRTHLSIVQGYRDASGKAKHRTVLKVGYLDELVKQYDDPIAHFKALATKMNAEHQEKKTVTIDIDLESRVEEGGASRKNFGHIVFSKVYHELEIDRFLKNARRHATFTFNTDAIMRLLVYTRLLHPGSKRAAMQIKESFFDTFAFTLDDVYDALTHFHEISDELVKHLHENVTKQYNRSTDLVYYDVTNYYFETDKADELRKKGLSKENKRKPIVQMGLLLDRMGLPISYKLFPGNTHDSQTLMPILAQVKKTFGVRRLITVADKGLNSGDNIAFNTALGDGYIFSKSIRGASAEFKQWVLDDRGYRHPSDTFKIKSKIVPDAEVFITVAKDGKRRKTNKIKLEQKWIVFYSEKYALRARHRRDETIAKALKMISNPAKYRSAVDYGAAGYIENIKIDKETGEVANTEDALVLNVNKIEEEAALDGYYAIVTSELDDTDEHIIELYRGLWRIEDTFKVSKSVLGTRPMYLRTQEHINAHFLVCFISLLIGRIVENRLCGQYTLAAIIDTLRQVACSHLDKNLWLFDYTDDITAHINTVFGLDIGKRVMTLQEIKDLLARSKK